MKILIIEDSATHREHAVNQLGKTHYLTVVSNAKDGLKFIYQGGWDAVLTDNQLPGYSGQPEAIGWGLALQAAKAGTPLVGVLTDANHHQDFSSRLMDGLCENQSTLRAELLQIENSKVLFSNKAITRDGKDWEWILLVLTGEEDEPKRPKEGDNG